MIRQINLIFFFLLISFMFSGCSSLNISSKWKNNEIKIDGNDTEWKEIMHNYGKFYLGCYNDDKFLYACISFNEGNFTPEQIKILNDNFTVSFYTLDSMSIIFSLKFSNNDHSFDLINTKPFPAQKLEKEPRRSE